MKHLYLSVLICISSFHTVAQSNMYIALAKSSPKESSSNNDCPIQLPATLSAMQESPSREGDRVRFGIKGGIQFSNMNFNKGYPKPAIPVENAWKSGVFLGVSWQLPLYKEKLFLKQEYLLSQVRGEDRRIETDYVLNYLSLPLLLTYTLLPRVSLMAGPQFELLIQANETANGISTKVTHDTEERSIGVVGGLAFQIRKNLSLSGRFMHGLNHVGISQRSARKEFKFEVLQAGLEFIF